MIRLAEDAVKARLAAARAFSEASIGRECGASVLRRPYLLDAFAVVPPILADLAAQLDGGKQ